MPAELCPILPPWPLWHQLNSDHGKGSLTSASLDHAFSIFIFLFYGAAEDAGKKKAPRKDLLNIYLK